MSAAPATATLASPRDTGAVATIVAVLLAGGVLLGMAALVVDVGLLHVERRQLQNGADSAALGVAMDCADGTCDTSTGGQAATLARANANDSAASVLTVCGAGAPALGSCVPQSGPPLTQCREPAAAAIGWVRVRTGTATADGGTLLPPVFARMLAGNAGYTGTQVGACAQAAWGAPALLDGTVPITISTCEWNTATANGAVYAPAPPYPPYPSSGEVALKLHTTSEVGTEACAGVGGAGANLPGGFGWLDADPACTVADIDAGGWVGADTGVGAAGCAGTLTASVGKVVYLPVFDQATGTGTNGNYHVLGFAAFYLSGYSIPGAHPNKWPSPVGGHLCSGSDKCIYGWFTQDLVPNSGALGGDPANPPPYLGASVVVLDG